MSVLCKQSLGRLSAQPEFAQNPAMNARDLQTLDESSYYRRLAGVQGMSLVLFSSTACGTCRVVERQLPLSAPSGAKLFKVDVQVASALARAFEVFHLPTLLLYRDGHYHARLNCPITPPALHAAIEQALRNPPEEEP